MIVAEAGEPKVALVGPLRLTEKLSSPSFIASVRMETVNVLLVSPGLKVSVPLAAV